MSDQQDPASKVPLYFVVNGMKAPPFVTSEHLAKLKGFHHLPDDVWVVSYPKSGTTWVQQIVKLIRNEGKQDTEIVSDTIPYVEYNKEVNLDELPRPRAFKSHFSYDQLPCGLPHTTPSKYIYVARNPKDVSVSTYFFFTSHKSFPPGISFEYFFTSFTEGELAYESWFDHVLSWWKHKDDQNVLFLKYEDMKKDLSTAVEEIGKFLGYDLSKELVDQIAEQTTFGNMKSNPLANYSWNPDTIPGATPFMRKGEVGDWKNHLSAEQCAYFDDIYAEKMKNVSLKFDFEI